MGLTRRAQFEPVESEILGAVLPGVGVRLPLPGGNGVRCPGLKAGVPGLEGVPFPGVGLAPPAGLTARLKRFGW